MKPLATTFALVLFTLTAIHTSPGLAQENPWTGKLPFKEGVIRCELSGAATGESVIYIKDYGATTIKYYTEVMTYGGQSMTRKAISLITTEWNYDLDLMEKTGEKKRSFVNCIDEAFEALSPGDKAAFIKNNEKLGLGMAEGLQGYITKNAATVLGYACDKVVNTMGMETLVFAGTNVALDYAWKAPLPELINTTREIKVGPVDPAKFILPKDITIAHDPDFDGEIRERAQRDIDKILKGEKPFSD